MENGITHSLSLSKPLCEVCGCTLSYLDSLQLKDVDYSVCRSFDCRRVMQKKNEMSDWQFKSHLSFQQKLLRDQQEKEASRRKHIVQATSREARENLAIIESIIEDRPDVLEGIQQVVVIPSGLSKLTIPAEERVNKYIEHLKQIIFEASELSDANEIIQDQHYDAHTRQLQLEQKFSKNPSLKSLSDQLCAMCKGGCCISGNEHAYLSVFTIKTLMDTNPHWTVTDILDLYISHISAQSVQNSCINQTENGCALPRNLRSDICNAFYCDPLKSCQKNMIDQKNIGKVIVIQRSNTYSSRFDLDVENKIINATVINIK